MRLLARFGVILLAYGCAVVIAALVIISLTALTQGVSDNAQFSEFLLMFVFLGLIAAVYALPVAVPTIVLSEWRRVGRMRVFAIAGIMLGCLLTIALTEIPYRGFDYALVGTMIGSSVAGALTYWLVAWRLLPPHGEAAASYSE